MEYEEFLKNFNVIEYLSNPERQEISGEKAVFEEKLQTIKKMEESGFSLLPLKVVGTIRQIGVEVPYFFTAHRFAYNFEGSYDINALIYYVFAKNLCVQDDNGRDIFVSAEGQKFVVEHLSGGSQRVPALHLTKPAFFIA